MAINPRHARLIAKAPVVTALMVAALCAAFWLDDSTRERTGIGPDPLPARWVFDGIHPKAIQFISYVFIHGNRSHLESNCLALLVAMTLCEWRLGPARLVASFALSAVATAAGFHLVDSRDLYGASGVAASMVVMAAVLWVTHREVRWWWRVAPMMLAIGYFGFTEILPAIEGHLNRGWRAHASGAVTGLTVGALFAFRSVNRTDEKGKAKAP